MIEAHMQVNSLSISPMEKVLSIIEMAQELKVLLLMAILMIKDI
jgi:hypothetical protein